MSQFRLPPQVPVPWARVDSSGEGGTNGAWIGGGGTDVYNYLMHTELLPAPANISLQTRLRAKLVGMTVDNPAFEGAAVLHRGFRMTGIEPNIKLDTQVWSSNPQAGGRCCWISGDHSDFQDYSFIVPLPEREGMDYVTWELVVRSPGYIVVSDVQCRHYYGKLYQMDISGYQRWDSDFSYESIKQNPNSDFMVFRIARYLKAQEIICRKGQNIVTSFSGMIRGSVNWVSTGNPAPCTVGFSLKLRRKGSSTEDWLDIFDQYQIDPSPTKADEARQKRARYDYDRAQLVVFVQSQPLALGVTVEDFIEYEDPSLDLNIADFVAPSQ